MATVTPSISPRLANPPNRRHGHRQRRSHGLPWTSRTSPDNTLFLAAPVASKGRLLQYAGRILRPYDGKATAEVHDYHDEQVGVLASSLAKRAPGYTNLGFPDPRKLPRTPSAATPHGNALVTEDH